MSIPGMRFVEYLTWSPDKLLSRLCDLTEELSSTYTEIGYTQAQEFSARSEAWQSPREESITGRTNDVRYAAATETISLLELEARSKSLSLEKELIERLLDA